MISNTPEFFLLWHVCSENIWLPVYVVFCWSTEPHPLTTLNISQENCCTWIVDQHPLTTLLLRFLFPPPPHLNEKSVHKHFSINKHSSNPNWRNPTSLLLAPALFGWSCMQLLLVSGPQLSIWCQVGLTGM